MGVAEALEQAEPLVLSMARRWAGADLFLVDDCAQESRLRIVANLHQLKSEKRFFGWARQVCRTACRIVIERQRKYNLHHLPFSEVGSD